LAVLATQGPSVDAAGARAAEKYNSSADAPLLSPDERDVLVAAADVLPEGAIVAGNPATGASLIYALTGHRALLPHMVGYHTKDSRLLATHLREAGSRPDVCAAAERL